MGTLILHTAGKILNKNFSDFKRISFHLDITYNKKIKTSYENCQVIICLLYTRTIVIIIICGFGNSKEKKKEF